MNNRWTIYVLALGVFLTATSELVVSGILPVLADDLNITVALAGQLVTVYSLAFAIGTPVVVSLTSRIDRKKTLLGSLAAFVLGSGLSYASTDISLLMASRVVLGVSSGVYLVGAFGAAAKLVPPQRIGSAIGTIVLGFSMAMILGVPIGIAITQWLDWRAIFAVLGMLSLLMTAVMYRLLPGIEGDARVPFKRQFQALGSAVIVSGLFLTLFRESGNSVLFTYLTTFMQDILRMDPAGIGVAMLVFGLFGAFGSRLGGYGVDRWGASRVIASSIVLHVATLALLPLFAGTPAAGLALIALMILSMFVSGPAVQTYFIQQAPESSSLVLSLNTSIVHVGLAAGAGAGGVLAGAASTVYYNPWLAGAIVALGLAAAIVSFSLGRKRVAQTAG
ncbi:MFS transporter [Paenibacillus flagellatus]|uniref:MFS transporter n=1 Tax=Paenibacillus flagellatus TaxID=2211139 RepID=A0A2V5JZ78_9BACL|nr:MFS transporter [Paenibacillus flagellatus]PYI51592.1 MFS transporter [Paenibacillus flagellatus]